MTTREDLAQAFLKSAGWGAAERQTLAGDASSRRYERLSRNGHSAILMDQPPGAETAACPPEASPAERRKLGYNAVARLAGPDVRPFAALARHLRSLGLAAPDILAADYANGFLLIEDLTDNLFARMIEAGSAETPLYERAIDVLVALHETPPPAALSTEDGWRQAFLSYDEEALLIETELLLDWFVPAALGGPASPTMRADFTGLWREALRNAASGAPVLVLRDYHAENLIWRPAGDGLQRIGLLDFQDGLVGSPAYDLVSLTEDARRDVDPALGEAMLARYIAGRQARDRGFDADAFRLAAAVLAAQRNTKILGIFTRLWKRDGKKRYPSYHPRLWRYLERDLAHPALKPLQIWLDRHIPAESRNRVAALVE